MRRPSTAATDQLSRLAYFSELTPEQRQQILLRASMRHFEPGAALLIEGEPAAGLFIVLDGLVKVYKTSLDGREQVLRYMGPGDSFNEVPAFDGGPNPASAEAAEPSDVLVLSRPVVVELVKEFPAFATSVLSVFAQRLRHLVTLVEDLSFRQVASRVARIILQSVEPHEGVGAGAGARSRITQREMAEMAGTSREVVARALKALEDSGAIEVGRQGIRVKDRLLLNSLA